MNISMINCATFCRDKVSSPIAITVNSKFMNFFSRVLSHNKCPINGSPLKTSFRFPCTTEREEKAGKLLKRRQGWPAPDLSFIEFPRFLSRASAKLSIQFVRAEYRFPIRDFGKHHRPYVYTRNPFDLRFHANKGGRASL